MSLLRRLKRRSSAERRMLFAALIIVVAVRIGLTVAPSRRIIAVVRRLSERPSRRPRGAAYPSTSEATIVWAVTSASSRVPGASCLTQALVAQLLMMRHGHPATLCLGIARSPAGEFRAHAWLENDGRIVLGGEQSRQFTRLPSIVAPRAEGAHP